jgi:hypothetical protein
MLSFSVSVTLLSLLLSLRVMRSRKSLLLRLSSLRSRPPGWYASLYNISATRLITITNFGQIRAAEDLMSLSRELKEMWLFGPLRSLNEGEATANARIDEDARAVIAIMDSLIRSGDGEQKAAEKSTGESTGDEQVREQAAKEDGDDREA